MIPQESAPARSNRPSRVLHLSARLCLLALSAWMMRHWLELPWSLTATGLTLMITCSCLVSGLLTSEADSPEATGRPHSNERTLRSLLVMSSAFISLSLLALILR